MISKEIVTRCIEFCDPPRIAMHFVVEPLGPQKKVWPFTDFASTGFLPDPSFPSTTDNTDEWMDEWGVVRKTLNPDALGHVRHHPFQKGYGNLEKCDWPDFTISSRYEHIPDVVAKGQSEGKYIYANILSIVLQLVALRGFEGWFADHVLERESLEYILDKIVESNSLIIEQYHKVGVDGVIMYDDWGINDREIISPSMFRDIYFPHYKKIIDNLHNRGMHIIHHCCGYIKGYMDMIVEAGCDVLQLDQPSLMDIDWLSENYGGKICFWNPVDIQKTMPTNDIVVIEDEARHQIWALGQKGGGFMVKAYQQPDAIKLTEEACEMQYQAFQKYAKYPLTRYEPFDALGNTK